MEFVGLKDVAEPRKLLGTMNKLIAAANESGASVYDVEDLLLAHKTLSGTAAVAMFTKLSVNGVTLASGTLNGTEACLWA